MDMEKRIKFAQLEKFEEFGHCGINNPHLDIIFKEGYISGIEAQQKEIEQLKEEIEHITPLFVKIDELRKENTKLKEELTILKKML